MYTLYFYHPLIKLFYSLPIKQATASAEQFFNSASMGVPPLTPLRRLKLELQHSNPTNQIAFYLLDLLCDECLPIMASGKAKMKRLKMKKFSPVISKQHNVCGCLDSTNTNLLKRQIVKVGTHELFMDYSVTQYFFYPSRIWKIKLTN